MPFSVLLSIYTKENPKYFNDCLKSLLEQSYLPNEIVIVKDGVIIFVFRSVEQPKTIRNIQT